MPDAIRQGRPKGKKTGANLTAMQIRRLKPGRHRASRDLYCLIRGGSRLWIHRHTGPDGRVHDMSLGSLDLVTLAEAREIVLANRKLLHQGKDPLARPLGQTFAAVAKLYYDTNKTAWGSGKYREQWWQQMERHIFPTLGKMPIQTITTADVLQVIQPLWGKLQYATVLRGRVEQIWYYAKAAKMVTGDNPAMMEGNLGPLLGDARQMLQTRHQPALPWPQVPAFMRELRATETIDARALELCILTNVRSDAVLGAKWSEIDLQLAVWTVPAERVKGRKATRKAFRVPLTARTLEILQTMPRYGEYVFGRKTGRPLGENAMLLLLRTFGRVDIYSKPIVVHGFRSAFDDWASETTHFPHTVIEMAMGHTIGKKVEAAYRRGDLYSQRMSLMADWSNYCGS